MLSNHSFFFFAGPNKKNGDFGHGAGAYFCVRVHATYTDSEMDKPCSEVQEKEIASWYHGMACDWPDI